MTDLDHDGNLEILKAKSGFDDGVPRLECEELLPYIKRGKAFFPLAESYNVFSGKQEKSEA